MKTCKIAKGIKFYKVTKGPWANLVVVVVPSRPYDFCAAIGYSDHVNIATGNWKPTSNNVEISIEEANTKLGCTLDIADIVRVTRLADGM